MSRHDFRRPERGQRRRREAWLRNIRYGRGGRGMARRPFQALSSVKVEEGQ